MYPNQNSQLSGAMCASQIPDRTMTPVEEKLSQLAMQIGCAQEGLECLANRLQSVRIVCPTEQAKLTGIPRPPEGCDVEMRLADAIIGVAKLNERLTDLRGELRI